MTEHPSNGSDPAPPDDVPPDADEVHRLHPLSLVFRVGGSVRSLFIPLLFVVFASGKSGEVTWIFWAVGVSLVYAVFHYVTYRYRFDGDEMVVKGGVVFRFERHIPYERVQNIDLSQNLFHRMFGVADVKIETASGTQAEAHLQVLSLEAVERMRARVFAGRKEAGRTAAVDAWSAGGASSAGAVPGAGPGAGPGASPGASDDVGAQVLPVSDQAAPRELVLRLGPLDLLLFGLISNRGMAVVLAAFGLFWEFGLFDHVEDLAKDVDLPDESLWDLLPLPLVVFTAMLLMILFMRALSVFWAFWKLHGFTLTRAGDDLQTRCGLFTRLTATIPRARIQAVTVRETLLHRWAGRVAVKVDTAGGSVLENSAATRSWVAPLVPVDQLDSLLDHLQPGLALSGVTWRPVHPRAVRRLCKRRLVGISLLVLPLAIWFSTWSLAAWPVLAGLAVWDARQRVPWMGFAVDERALVVRTGLWTRQTRAVRHTKIQVIHQGESPFDRRWGMRTLGVDAAGSLSRTQLPYLTSESALELGDLLASRAGRHAFRW